MKLVIGGSIAIILGFFCLAAYFDDFLNLMAGTIPLMLVIGGCLVIMLNRDNECDCDEADTSCDTSMEPAAASSEIESESAPVSEPESQEETSSEPVEYIGNDSTMVFHTTDCRYSKSSKCTVVFKNRDEAVKQDYKPCGVCKP